MLLPTVVPIGAPEEVPELRRPEPEDETPLAQWARKLDAIITEAVQDLGLQLDVSNRITLGARTLSEDALLSARVVVSVIGNDSVEPFGDVAVVPQP